jgi:diaminohydroxyphosphoribosylaminopyrimidine deaminase / 5-amino-6-(5-phosphoribosylamino)uracil reductase
MNEELHPLMMRRAIELAMRGRGTVEPNPSVGCVIVKDGRIIGEGHTQPYGGAHAEPTALANCTESPAGATAYVTLEPCCHLNKQTPPCVPRLIAAKISRIVVGCLDPNPQVNGQGIAQLRQAGIEAITGVLEDECRQLIAPFIAATQYQRPYITLKWAQDAAGKIAGVGGKPLQISNQASVRAVHALRARCDAIVVGINTVLSDNPQLTIRHAESVRPLARYVLDRGLRMPIASQLVQSARQTSLIVATDISQMNSYGAIELRQYGVEIISAGSLHDVVSDWHRRKFAHVLVEPGPTLAAAITAENLADRVWIFRSPKFIAEENAPPAFVLPDYFRAVGQGDIDGDQLTEYLNTRSPVFFAEIPSADFRHLKK